MASRRGRRTQAERSGETQGRLLDATIDCLVARGLSETSTLEVCRRARASRGAMLHHYPTRADLVAAAIERIFDARLRELGELLGTAPSPGRVLEALWRIYTGKTFYAWAELLVAARTDRALRARLRAVDDRFFAQACQIFRALSSAPSEHDARIAAKTRFVLSILDGLALNHTLGGREAITRAVLAELERMLFPDEEVRHVG